LSRPFFRFRDQDLGLQVLRPRPRPGQNELECTRVSRPSRDHNTGCVNSNWWQSTRLKVLHYYGNRATGVGNKHAVLRPRPRPWPEAQDVGLQVLRPETETWTKWTRVHSSLETMVSRSQRRWNGKH